MRGFEALCVVGAVVLALGLSACAPDKPVTATGEKQPTGSGPAMPAPGLDPELVQQRQDAGIPPCPETEGAGVDEGLPDLTLECIGGDSEVRLAGLRGPMVVNVWAQWCGPCRKEAPFLAEFAADNPDVAMLGIDYADPHPDAAIEFAAASDWTWPHVVDPQRTVAADLNVIGPPVTVFVDAEGRITHTHTGPFTSTAQIQRVADEHLAR